MKTTDEELCERVAVHRDAGAFDALVERYRERAYRLAWSILRDGEDARDLSQDAFLRLYEAASSFRGRSRFSTWFFRILVNLCLDHRRRERRWQRAFPAEDADDSGLSIIERQPAPVVDPSEEIGRREVMSRLWVAVGQLSAQQRAALMLQVQEEMATADIAVVLKCSEATVRVHLHRALLALKKTVRKDPHAAP